MKFSRFALAIAISVIPLKESRSLVPMSRDRSFPSQARVREIRDEVDPATEQACYSMGQMTLSYDGGELGPPNVGLRITDPRGRKIGYDLQADRGWQELPLAQGSFDCDENENASELRHCVGHIQICGPISGTYKVEVLPARRGKYSVKISGTSQETRDATGFHSTDSRVEFKSEVQNLEPQTLLLEYSRDAGAQIKLTRIDQRVARTEEIHTEDSPR